MPQLGELHKKRGGGEGAGEMVKGLKIVYDPAK